MQNIDMASLRSFVSAVEAGGFAKAAIKMNRTPGAISLQMKSLEERLGAQLFAKGGKRQQLTASGNLLLDYARRILQTNDEALMAIRGANRQGHVRFGMPQDLAECWVTEVLSQFSRACPSCRIEIKVGRSGELQESLSAGSLDLIVSFGPLADADPEQVAALPIHWWSAQDLVVVEGEPLPLLTLRSCCFRDASIQALEAAGIPFWVALESDSVSATWRAADAGLGFFARSAIHVPERLRITTRMPHLPTLGAIGLFLRTRRGEVNAATAYLHGILHEVLVRRCRALAAQSDTQ